MEFTLGSRLRHALNAFSGNRDPTGHYGIGTAYYQRPDRPRFTRGNEKSIITSRYNRIAMDVAGIRIVHAQLDENERFKNIIDSGLNECLNLSANLDQTGRAFIQDIAMSMLDEGNIAIVPIDTEDTPEDETYDIYSMRVGKILEWYPAHVKVRVYNERTGKKEDVVFSKETVAIVENPLYAVVNEPNSMMQRLKRKLALLDAIDEYSGSGKLDLIIQLPYVIKSEARKKQANDRRKDIADQLKNSEYGIAYTDGTEKITQLNRPVENNLLKQVEYLMAAVDGQLGITQAVMDGTADEKTMLNYHNRTTEPILAAIVDSMKRRFLTKKARSDRQSIVFFREPFKLVPASEMAEIADKFTRNKIMTANEIRQIVGMKPSDDPEADKLKNSNIREPASNSTPVYQESQIPEEGETSQNGN